MRENKADRKTDLAPYATAAKKVAAAKRAYMAAVREFYTLEDRSKWASCQPRGKRRKYVVYVDPQYPAYYNRDEVHVQEFLNLTVGEAYKLQALIYRFRRRHRREFTGELGPATSYLTTPNVYRDGEKVILADA